jgi:hypothetical protein
MNRFLAKAREILLMQSTDEEPFSKKEMISCHSEVGDLGKLSSLIPLAHCLSLLTLGMLP